MKWAYTIALIFASTFLSAQSTGEPSYIKSIFFGGGSSRISYDQALEFSAFLDSIPNVHNFIITVHSHTDDIGGSEYNKVLSSDRSESVIKLLLNSKKVKKESIETRDFGLFNPTYDNSTNYGRRMNRRVDIIFWLAI